MGCSGLTLIVAALVACGHFFAWLFGVSDETGLLIFVVICVIFGILAGDASHKERLAKVAIFTDVAEKIYDYLHTLHGFTPTAHYTNPDSTAFIAVDGTRNTLLTGTASPGGETLDHEILPASRLLSAEVQTRGNGRCDDPDKVTILLRITRDDLRNPYFDLKFVEEPVTIDTADCETALATAEKWQGIITVLRQRATQPTQENGQGNPAPTAAKPS